MKVGNALGFICGIMFGMVGTYGFVQGLEYWGVWLLVSIITIFATLVAVNQ